MEKELLSVEVMTVPAGKVRVAAPTGPVTSRSALSGSVVGSLVCGQPLEVVTVKIWVSMPLVGLKVRVPRVPAGGTALATAIVSIIGALLAARTTAPATSQWRNLVDDVGFTAR